MKPWILHLAVAFVLAGKANAELKFERKGMALTAVPGEVSVTAIYPFKNVGTTPVTITQTEASCDCTTADTVKRTYAPDEAGEISVTFRLGAREGHQRKFVTVHTDEQPASNYVLRLEVDIPVVATLSPRLLLWRGKGPYESKLLKITSGRQGEYLKLVRTEEPSGRFIIVPQPPNGDQTISLSVTPEQSDRELQSELTVTLETAQGKLVSYKAYLRCIVATSPTVP